MTVTTDRPASRFPAGDPRRGGRQPSPRHLVDLVIRVELPGADPAEALTRADELAANLAGPLESLVRNRSGGGRTGRLVGVKRAG